MTVPLLLSATKPDFASLVLQLQLYLQAKDTWQDLQTSGTGQTLLEMMAATGAFNQFGIESAVRETSLLHARRDSSIYAITRMLGVRIHRKTPASVGVNLSRVDTSVATTLPKFTQFSINSADFFCRNPLVFSKGSDSAAELLYYGTVKPLDSSSFKMNASDLNVSALTVGDEFQVYVHSGAGAGELRQVQYRGVVVGGSKFVLAVGQSPFVSLTANTRISVLNERVYLYQGTIQTDVFISDGTIFQQMYVTPDAFTVSDVDVRVVVVNPSTGLSSQWSNIDGGIWNAAADSEVYFDTTSGNGETIIAFGDGEHGQIPPLGSRIQVTYASTLGSAANNGLTSFKVSCPEFNWIDGDTITVISGGADNKNASFYRHMAPRIFKARNRAVTQSDYEAVALDYPGVVSAGMMGQRDIAPGDLRWMNVVQMCVLPIDPGLDKLSAGEQEEFRTYMDGKKHAAVHLVSVDPTRLDVIIELTVALKSQYTASAVLPVVESNVRALFARRADTLGRRITVSDVMYAVKTIEGVDYVDVDICQILDSGVLVNDLIPLDNTYFLSLSSYLANVKYSERTAY